MSATMSKQLQDEVSLLVRFNNDIGNDGNNSLDAIISNYQKDVYPNLSDYLVNDKDGKSKSAIKCRPNRDWDIKINENSNMNLLTDNGFMLDWSISFNVTLGSINTNEVDSIVISDTNNHSKNMKICLKNRLLWIELNGHNNGSYINMKNNPIDLSGNVGTSMNIVVRLSDYRGVEIFKDGVLIHTISIYVFDDHYSIVDASGISIGFIGSGIHTFDEFMLFNIALEDFEESTEWWFLKTPYLLGTDYTFEPVAFNSDRVGVFRWLEDRYFHIQQSISGYGRIMIMISDVETDAESAFNNNIGKIVADKEVEPSSPTSQYDAIFDDPTYSVSYCNSPDMDTHNIGPITDTLHIYFKATDRDGGSVIYTKTQATYYGTYSKFIMRKKPDPETTYTNYNDTVWRRESITESMISSPTDIFDYNKFAFGDIPCLVEPVMPIWYDTYPSYHFNPETGITFQPDVMNYTPWRLTVKAKSKRFRIIGSLNRTNNDSMGTEEYLMVFLTLNNADISTPIMYDNGDYVNIYGGGEIQKTYIWGNDNDDVIIDIEIVDYDIANDNTVSLGFSTEVSCDFNIKAVDYYIGEEEESKYPEVSLPIENAPIKKRLEFDPELFEKITYGEFINAQLDIAGYAFYQTDATIVNIEDKRILDSFGKFKENTMITFRKRGEYLNREDSAFFITVNENGVNKQYLMDIYDPSYEIFMFNDYVYIYSRRFEVEGFSLVGNSIGVLKANKENILTKEVHTLADYTAYTDNFFRIVLTNSSTIQPITTTLPGIKIAIKIPHINMVLNKKNNIDFNKITAAPGICYNTSGFIFTTGIDKLNKFIIRNNQFSTLTMAVPYMLDIYDRSYYEGLVKSYYTKMQIDIMPAIEPLHRKVQNMKLHLDHTSDYFKDYLSEIYRYDAGIYEKLLMEQTLKPFYLITNRSLTMRDSTISYGDKSIGDYYTFLEKVFIMSIYDINDSSEFEIYVNGRLIHRKPSAIVYYAGKKYIYLSRQCITKSWKKYVIDNKIATISEVQFVTEDECFTKYYTQILSSITIFIKRRRSDYRAFHTGVNDLEMNVVELPLGSGRLYGMSIFVDGLRLSANDYYYERIAGIQCAILKRKYNKDSEVTVTYYLNPINMVIKEIAKTNRISTRVSAEGDDVFVDGCIVTPETSYTPDVSNMAIFAESENTSYTITHITYSDTKSSIAVETDYRSKLLEYSSGAQSWNLWNTILNFTAIKVPGKPRQLELADIEAYVFYLKYLVGGEHEPDEVYAMIDGNLDLTQTERDRLKAKYTTLFSEGDMFFYGGVEKDFPQDIIIGDIETNIDVRARSYKDTVNAILYIFKGNYIKATDEDIVYDMNYIGQDIVI